MGISVSITNLGKKFGSEWIFRNLSCQVTANQKLVILGGNGSGKSTLLQVISSFVTHNEGSITYTLGSNPLLPEKLKDHISFASPYLQLIEDFTLPELIEHAGIYKPFVNHLTVNEVISLLELSAAKNKFIKQFSSGMKQRLKLGLAILADTPLLLLDEPVSNLDKNAIEWYKQLIAAHMAQRTVMVCSNAITDEYFFCDHHINVMDFKVKAKQ